MYRRLTVNRVLPKRQVCRLSIPKRKFRASLEVLIKKRKGIEAWKKELQWRTEPRKITKSR